MNKILFFSALLCLIVFAACQKENDPDGGEMTLKVLLTDNPLDAEEVNVEIQRVQVKMEGDGDDQWIELETNAGVYNLLDLQNGVTTPLAEGPLPGNRVKEIRVVLGSQNDIVIAGETFPLTTPSAQSSGIKIKVDKAFQSAIEELVIDFDAALSVHLTGNGMYILNPVIRVK